ATLEVRGSITSIQDLAKVNMSGMAEAVTAIDKVNKMSEDTVAALTEVRDIVKETTAQAQSIAKAVEAQSASSQAVTSLVDEVHNISKSNDGLITKTDEELQGLMRKAKDLLEFVGELRGSGNK
ncbi:MAG: hypothetical protein FWG17_07035, partial [Desulfovibrionaceae bacterium]|nr:hypothetical protein [Desulfovibrionaceae bacterium]